jgi:hypothetical protein
MGGEDSSLVKGLGEEMPLVICDEAIDRGFQSCGEDRVRWIGGVFYDFFNGELVGILDDLILASVSSDGNGSRSSGYFSDLRTRVHSRSCPPSLPLLCGRSRDRLAQPSE